MDNQTGGKLPPLPPSDADSLQRNYYDRFYQVSSRGFWGKNEINSTKNEPMKKCNHYFESQKANFICKHCRFGLQGSIGLTLSDGKLSYNNEPIPFGA